ncbi:MAG: HlyD [Hyphomicrobiales bacterium]|nr:HlyD [Hyphomicrobiales bacterium]
MSAIWAFLTGLVALVIPGFGAPAQPIYTGYVEADYVYVAPAAAGTIASIPVKEAQAVHKGDVLFTLSAEQQQALLRAAQAQVAAAKADAENLSTGGRTEELDVARASLKKAEADLALAQTNADRTAKLYAQGFAPQSRLDQDNATLASARAQANQLQAQLAVTELPARNAQQAAAEASLAAAQAQADKAAADLADRTVVAPTDGRIERVYYSAGEMAALGTPVVSLLPDAALKVKFYINEANRTAFKLGDTVGVTCDGCAPGLKATLSFLASDPQTTPPIIYSRDERSRLVFLAEARLAATGGVLPGQPVTVSQVAAQ